MPRGGARIGSGPKSARPKTTVQLKMGLGPCPKELSAEAKNVWRKWAPVVEKLTSVCEADRSTFQHFCDASALYAAAVEDVQTKGSVLRLKTGDGGETVRQNPSVRHVLEFGRFVDGLRLQLGLSPVARARLKIQVESEEDQSDFDRFLNRGKSVSPVKNFLQWKRSEKRPVS